MLMQRIAKEKQIVAQIKEKMIKMMRLSAFQVTQQIYSSLAKQQILAKQNKLNFLLSTFTLFTFLQI